jgi:ABC-2 type transport system permease protein
LSVSLGYLVSYLYVILLFTNVNFVDLIVALLFYLLWILFIVSFTTMISTIFNNQGIIALISIVCLLFCRIIVGLSPIIDNVNPANMSQIAVEVLILGTVRATVLWNIIVTLLLTALTIIISYVWISKKKFTNE